MYSFQVNLPQGLRTAVAFDVVPAGLVAVRNVRDLSAATTTVDDLDDPGQQQLCLVAAVVTGSA